MVSPVMGHARLRMMQFRGELTATMVYDQHPILDHFKRVDVRPHFRPCQVCKMAKLYKFAVIRQMKPAELATLGRSRSSSITVMPRLPRLHAPGAVYHVTARGNHRNDIFFKHADRKLLDDIMAHALERTGARIHAYCWMTNHLHLLVQVNDQPLGRLMQRVGTRFARAIQKELSTTGHLFENRYHALLVDVDSYFLELLRYIHLNPVKARIVTAPEQYRWSSHRVYLGKTTQSWVHTTFGLRLFAQEEDRARALYKAFIDERVGSEPDPPEAHPLERRVLGDDRFLDKLAIPTQKRRPVSTIDDIVADVALALDITVAQICSHHQHRQLSKARALIAARAIDEQVATLSEVARYFNRSASALSRAIARYATSGRCSPDQG